MSARKNSSKQCCETHNINVSTKLGCDACDASVTGCHTLPELFTTIYKCGFSFIHSILPLLLAFHTTWQWYMNTFHNLQATKQAGVSLSLLKLVYYLNGLLSLASQSMPIMTQMLS